MRRTLPVAGLLALILSMATVPHGDARVIDGVVAVVGEEPVTFSEVRDVAAEGLGIPAGDADLYLREEKDTRRVLHWIESLVESVLVRRELAKIGQPVTDAEIGRAVESVRKTNKLSEAEFSEALARDGITLEGYRARLRWQMERGAIVRAKKLKDVTVTDEEVKAYFRENEDRFREGGEILLETLHLPVPPEESGSEGIVRLRIAAQQAGEYVRSGRTLSEAADLLSTTLPGASVASSDFVPTDDLMPEIQKEIRKLRSGETSAPFFTEGGAYLITVKARRGGVLPEFSSLSNALTEELADRRSEKAYTDILAELKKAASIDIRL
ncbi:MAG TPA: SurA N-terminal domain-containing protein [Candidatus Limnocylindrales bacterium]|nr:SurA N-terminal domain-containing protein [Candidatus Limnocylindrales bacterium]